MEHELIVIGASWGGLHAVGTVLTGLGDAAAAGVVVAQHRGPGTGELLAPLLQRRTALVVREAEDKDSPTPGVVLVAPTDYHTLVEDDGKIALSTEGLVQNARPSIDVLFRSAAEAHRERCIGVVLTGTNEDGADGLARIEQLGGLAVVQQPDTAERSVMPGAALAATRSAVVLPLEEIGPYLRNLGTGQGSPT